MFNSFDLPIIIDASGEPVSVIVPIELWIEMKSKLDTAVNVDLSPLFADPEDNPFLVPSSTPITEPLNPELSSEIAGGSNLQLDLPGEVLNEVLSILHDKLPGMEIWAYGSRVSGRSTAASDLELVICSPDRNSIAFEVFNNAQAAMIEADLPIIVQMVDWARISESYRRDIGSRYVVLSR